MHVTMALEPISEVVVVDRAQSHVPSIASLWIVAWDETVRVTCDALVCCAYWHQLSGMSQLSAVTDRLCSPALARAPRNVYFKTSQGTLHWPLSTSLKPTRVLIPPPVWWTSWYVSISGVLRWMHEVPLP